MAASRANDVDFSPLNDFFQTNRETIFCVNVIVRQELLKRVYSALVVDHLNSQPNPKKKYTEDHVPDKVRKILQQGQKTQLSLALAGKVKHQLSVLERGFEYLNDDRVVTWEDAFTLMEAHCLNGPDSMIYNFALAHCDGIVSRDEGFRHVEDIGGFNIYLPKRFI